MLMTPAKRIYGAYVVTCESCGRVIATGIGNPTWEQPHDLCPTTAVKFVLTYTERLTR
ncbi:MAG: hypothetical protein NUW01_18650 [Gemmatimonadaceae bacterium]|nr:hypothetical protein [Gemmatimonadaceae bacterium]